MIRYNDEWFPIANPEVIKRVSDLEVSFKGICERLVKIEKALSDYLGVE